MTGQGSDVPQIAPLRDVPGESAADRETRLLQHIASHVHARDLALRTDIARGISRAENRMNTATAKFDEDLQRLDNEVRAVPAALLGMKSEVVAMKSELLQALRGGGSSGTTWPAPPAPAGAWAALQSSWWLQVAAAVLMVSIAVFVGAAGVGLLSLSIGGERAADVADGVVDKLPSYTRPEPVPVPQPVGTQPVPSPG